MWVRSDKVCFETKKVQIVHLIERYTNEFRGHSIHFNFIVYLKCLRNHSLQQSLFNNDLTALLYNLAIFQAFHLLQRLPYSQELI